jgi:hypothetical protein
VDDKLLKQLKQSNFYFPEITDIVYDSNKTLEIINDWINITEKGFDTLWDSMMFNFLMKYCKEGIFKAKEQIKDKGIKIRMITETTKENIEFIDSLNCPNMKHLDDIRGNFGIFDKRAYMVYIFHKQNEKPDQTLWNNSKVLVEQQQILFDRLWEISMPFSTRKKELENDKNPYIETTFTDFRDIQQEILSTIERSRKELLICSSVKLFNNLINMNTFTKYFKILLKRDIIIKILFDHIDLRILEQVFEINNTSSSNKIQIGYTNNLGNFNELAMITDQKFVMQIKYDNLLNLNALGSSEEHKVLLQSIIFEKYWNEIKSLTGIEKKTKGDMHPQIL